MDNLIALHEWNMEEQYFLDIPDSDKYLSIVPEYLYKYRDANDKIIVSRTPVGTKLNCALFIENYIVEYVEFYEEKDFFNYIISQK